MSLFSKFGKSERWIAVLAVLAILVAIPFVSFAKSGGGVLGAPPSDPATVQSVDLSSVISSGLYIRYDQANNYAWVSGPSGNALASINLNTVIASGASQVKTYSGIFPSTSTVGNLLSGAIGLTLLNKLAYTDAIYSSGVALASVDPTSGTSHQYYTSLASTVSALASKDSTVFLAAGPGILEFNTGTSTFSSISTKGLVVNDLAIVGNTIYFAFTNTTKNTGGLGQVNTDGSGFIVHDFSTPTNTITFDSSGNIWLTSSDILLEWDGSSFQAFVFDGSTVMHGPIGLVPTPGGISVWGDEYKVVRFFQFAQNAFNPSLDVTTGSLRPWAGILDSSGNMWGFALGDSGPVRFVLYEITSALTSTVTTTATSTVTSTVTSTPATTTTKTTTSTSVVTQTSTTVVTSGTATSTITQTTTSVVTSAIYTVTTTTTLTAILIFIHGHHCGGPKGWGGGGNDQGSNNNYNGSSWWNNGNGNGDHCWR